MMSARIPLGDSAVSPPASVTPYLFRQTDQAAGEASHPGLRQIPRQRQREKGRHRLAAHGGNIAQSARQAAMADRFRRMPVAPEVNAFQREVGRDQGFVSRRQAQHGAVISNSGEDRTVRAESTPTSGGFRHAANLGNQRFFGKRHGATTIPPVVRWQPFLSAGFTAIRDLGKRTSGNLSLGAPGYPAFGNRKMPYCLVDRGNPVCYR